MNLELPDREQVVAVLMDLYSAVFFVIFLLAIVTISICIWNLIPRKEY